MNQIPAERLGAVDKVFLLLQAFRPEDFAGIGVSELSRRTQLSKSTTHRILGELVDNGAVARMDRLYRLGPMFYQLTANVSANSSERIKIISEELTPFLAALFERTRQTVHLACLEGPDVYYVNKLFSVNRVAAPSWIGGGIPAYCTGIGKALLAFDEAMVKETIRRGLHPWTSSTITDPVELERELAQIRTERIAYDNEENTVGLYCIAAPIFGRDGLPVAGLSVSGPAESFTSQNQQMYITALKKITAAAAKAYSRRQK
ncbi:IclR family transcriptional regulator [Corynebacterium glutamicum]|uniref:IclR family transcriptional regulator n=1 Tax=Corynebacterium glutamicum TaxID=1718 RepID=UPI003C7DA6D1